MNAARVIVLWRRSRVHLAAAGLASTLVGLPLELNGQDSIPSCGDRGFTWGVGPALVSGPGEDRLGAVVDLTACIATGHMQLAQMDSLGLQDGYPASYIFRIDVDAAWTPTTVQVPQKSTFSLAAGWSVSLSMPHVRAPAEWPIDSLDAWEGGGFNRGWIEIGLAAEHEVSADWRERNVLGSAQLRYGLNRSGWWRLVPSVVAHLDAVVPVASEARDTLGLSDDGHLRWGVRGYLNTGLDFVDAALVYLRVGVDMALYRTAASTRCLKSGGGTKASM